MASGQYFDHILLPNQQQFVYKIVDEMCVTKSSKHENGILCAECEI